MKIYKMCKLCKRPANEVTLIHKTNPHSLMLPGYCTNCQEWVLIFFAISLMGIGTILAGLIDLNFKMGLIGLGIFILGFLGLDIVSAFIPKR